MLKKVEARIKRHARIRSKVSGTAAKPRLNVFRSNTNIYAQIIDDIAAKTLASASDLKIKKGTKSEKAAQVGKLIAEAWAKAWISEVVFDRGWFQYIGRVKALADAAREAGLKF